MAKKKGKKSKWGVKLDTVCEVCGKPQYETSSGDTCKNGHGGAYGIPKERYKELLKRKKKNFVKNHIYIQIGDDEGDHEGLYYVIVGAQGEFSLRAYRKETVWNSIDEKEVDKQTCDKTYYTNLRGICKKLLRHELTEKDAVTLGQMLEVLNSIDERLESLEETIFLLSEEEEEEE